MNFVIPPKSQVGVFNPADIGEEQSIAAVLSSGSEEKWNPPALQTAFPDWSKVPSLRKYFGREGGPVYPAWLFHPVEADRKVENAEEAAELGVFYREATRDEQFQFGKNAVWDWKKGDDDRQWRPFPQQRRKFDPHHMETGKIYVATNTPTAQPSIESIVAAVTATVLAALKASPTPAVPGVTSEEMEELIALRALRKTTETVNALVVEEDDERESWIAEAERLGMKVDKRWSTERLKSEVSKAA